MGAVQQVTLLELDRYLHRQVQRLSNPVLHPMLQSIAVAAVADTKTRFATATSPQGVPWVPLAHPRIISHGADKPLRDTGLLMASIQARVTRNELILSSNLEYAGVHQWGATIKPKRGKMLAIPLTKEAKRHGSPRHPRPFPRPLFVLASAGHSPVLAERIQKGKGKKRQAVLVIHYVLVPSVTIPARPFLGFSKDLKEEIAAICLDAVAKQMRFDRRAA